MPVPGKQYDFSQFTVFSFDSPTVTATNNCFGCDAICDGEMYSCDMCAPEPDAAPAPHKKATPEELKSMSGKELLQHIAATLDKIAEQQAYIIQNGVPTRERW